MNKIRFTRSFTEISKTVILEQSQYNQLIRVKLVDYLCFVLFH